MVRKSNAKCLIKYIISGSILTACYGQSFPQAKCERITLTHSSNPVIGIEDMDYDEQSKTLYLSAYDRRTHSLGGVYTMSLRDEQSTGTVEITPIISGIRPHGMDVLRHDPNVFLSIIDRTGTHTNKKPVIRVFQRQDFEPVDYIEIDSFEADILCASNDLVFSKDEHLYITQDHQSCDVDKQFKENITSPNKASVILAKKTRSLSTFIDHLSFANGIVLSKDNRKLYIAETRKKHIAIYNSETAEELNIIDLAGGPDNLTRSDDDIYVALIPSLIGFSQFQKRSKNRIKSRFAVIQQDTSVITYDVPANIISGATVAIKAGKHVWLGAAYDTAIARCILPKEAL